MVKVSRVPTKEWDKYKSIINDFIDEDAGKQPFVWLRKINQPLAYGEDSGIRYLPVILEGLFQYNYIRTWPANKNTLSGELEGENMVLYISARILRENGYVNEFGYPDLNWSEDRFLLNGKIYKPDGDTQVAQAKDEALLFFIILKREEPQEATQILNSQTGIIQVVKSGTVSEKDYTGNTLIQVLPNILKRYFK